MSGNSIPFAFSRNPLSQKIVRGEPSGFGNINANITARPVTAARPSGGVLSSITLNGVTISPSLEDALVVVPSSQLATPGIAQANKVAIAGPLGELTNISSVSCGSLWVNNIQYQPSAGGQAASSDDASSPYLSIAAITPGTATNSTALVMSSNTSIAGLNMLTANHVVVGNACLVGGGEFGSSTYHTGVYHRRDMAIRHEAAMAAPMTVTSLRANQTPSPYVLTGVFAKTIYSEELDIYVAVIVNNLITTNGSAIVWSRNGFSWNMGTNVTNDSSRPMNYNSSSFKCIGYSPELIRFVAYSHGTGAHLSWWSDDGINWQVNYNSPLYSTATFSGMCWNPDRGEFLMTGTRVCAKSTDGITWVAVSGMPVLGSTTISDQCIYHRPSRSYLVATRNMADGSYLARSSDGISWAYVPSVAGSTVGSLGAIAYSPELNIIVASTSESNVVQTNYVVYSTDGGMTFKHANCADKVAGNRILWINWVSKLKMFFSGNDAGAIGHSYDGIAWHYTTGTAIAPSIMWNNKFSTPITRESGGDSRLRFFQTNQVTGTSSSISFTRVGTRIGFGGVPDAVANVSIYSNKDSGGIVKFRSPGNLSIGQIDGDTGKISIRGDVINVIPTLQLNSTTSINSMYLQILSAMCYRSTQTNSTPLSLAIVDSTGALNSSGPLVVDSLTYDSTTHTSASTLSGNHTLLSSSTVGVATANKALTHLNGAVEADLIECLEMRGSSVVVSGSGGACNVSMDSINSLVDMHETNSPSRATLAYTNDLVTRIMVNGGVAGFTTASRVFFVPGINKLVIYNTSTTTLFIASGELSAPTFNTVTAPMATKKVVHVPEVKRTYFLMTSGLMYSTDIVSFKYCNLHAADQINDLAYSPSLRIYVAVSTTNGLLISHNGVDWYRHMNELFSVSAMSATLILWSKHLNMFVGVTSAGLCVYSYNGYHWVSDGNKHLFNSESNALSVQSIAQSTRSGVIVCNSKRSIMYSKDGKVFIPAYSISTSQNRSLEYLLYVDDLDIFICTLTAATSGSNGTYLAMSRDGLRWYHGNGDGLSNISSTAELSYASIPTYNQVTRSIMFTGTATAGLFAMDSTKINAKNFSWTDTLLDSGLFQCDNVNARFGIGISPQYTLHLSRDSAVKPTSATWSTTSDLRLKADIEPADLDKCLETIESIPLKHYRWKDSVYDNKQINDRSQLGWIAQDVEKVLPKSVTVANVFPSVVPDGSCRQLNNDQIIANMYGALQKLIEMDASLDEYFE
jgi:hypothetical protein